MPSSASLRAWIPCGAFLGATFGMLVASNTDASPWPTHATRIEAALTSRSGEERLAAARKLASLGSGLARRAVKKALLDDDPRVRRVGAKTAVFFQYEEYAPLAVDWLSSQDAAERIEGLTLIALRLTADEAPAVASLVTDPNADVRRAAVETLGRARADAVRPAVTALLGGLDDANMAVRREAARSLGNVGGKDVALTVAAHLQDQESDVRTQLALALGVLGDPSVTPALLVALSDPEPVVVSAAATSLGMLGSADSVFGLSSVAEDAPFSAPAERAVEALGLLDSRPAYDVLISLLENADRRRFVELVLEKSPAGAKEPLEQCLATATGEVLLACMRVSVARNESSAPLLQALQDGRVAAAQLLALLTGKGNRDAIVLALEQLTGKDERSVREALRFLQAEPALPSEAEAPVRDAVERGDWDAREVATLLELLSRIPSTAGHEPWMLSHLEASDDSVQAAAARLIVSRGAQGELLEKLLFQSPAKVRQAALSSLSLTGRPAQIEEVIGWISGGRLGRRRALASLFERAAAPQDQAAISALREAWSQETGASRDALLPLLARSLRAEDRVTLLDDAAHADRLLLAQLAWYLPGGHLLERRLVVDENPRVVALALVGLGLAGDARDVKVLFSFTGRDPGRANFVRAAAYTGLLLLGLRGQWDVDVGRVPADACSSEHLGLRGAALQLFSQARKQCGDTSLEDLVRLDPDARIRALAASLLRSTQPDSKALRRCALYEPRVEVATSCGFSVFLPGVASVDEAHDESDLPYSLLAVEAASGGQLAANVPFAIRFRVPPSAQDGAALGPPASDVAGPHRDVRATVVTDRRGHLFLPRGQVTLLDDVWAY